MRSVGTQFLTVAQEQNSLALKDGTCFLQLKRLVFLKDPETRLKLHTPTISISTGRLSQLFLVRGPLQQQGLGARIRSHLQAGATVWTARKIGRRPRLFEQVPDGVGMSCFPAPTCPVQRCVTVRMKIAYHIQPVFLQHAHHISSTLKACPVRRSVTVFLPHRRVHSRVLQQKFHQLGLTLQRCCHERSLASPIVPCIHVGPIAECILQFLNRSGLQESNVGSDVPSFRGLLSGNTSIRRPEGTTRRDKKKQDKAACKSSSHPAPTGKTPCLTIH